MTVEPVSDLQGSDHQPFDKIPHPRSTPAMTHMLKRLSKHLPSSALETLHNLLRLGWSDDIDHVAISIALKCFRGDLSSGTQIHAIAISSGLDSYVSVSNSLMNMYSKSRQFDQALVIFEAFSNRDIVSWNTILSGFHQSDDALGFMLRMCQAGIGFDAVTYTTALALFAEVGELDFGLQLHSLVLKSGFDSETFVCNALISFYARYHCLNEAKRVFDKMSNRDLVSWNALISGYTQEGDYGLEAIWVFVEMLKEGMELDHVSFASVISACGHERSLDLGRQIHGLALKAGCGIHVSVSNVLLSMYSKCEIAEDAKVVFENMVERNVISWTTMISIDEGNAVSLFNEMRRDGVYPNDVTFVGLVPAVSTENSVKDGQMIHVFCLKTGFLSEVNVSNCLITMYAKFMSMEESKRVFDELNYREIVSWNALISGYAQNGLCQEALQTFSFMILEEKPNQFTFGSILSSIASAEAVSLMHGRQSHCWIIKLGLNTDEVVLGALVHMYAKRGSITESQLVFDEVPQRSLVAWTAIITSHAMHGDYESVMSLFKRMERARVQPDSITFLAVLTACSRRGMVNVGRQVFNSMVRDHLIEPSAEHFSCMVDMLGRVGQLEEAEEFMKRMPTGPGLSALQSLLGACRIHGNVEMGKRVSDALMEMGPMESGVYVLMSNIYAEKGEWENVAKIRIGMRERGVKKEVGRSWVDVVHVDGAMHMHGFTSNDRSHPRAEEICRMVECLGLEMRFLEREGDSEWSFETALKTNFEIP